MSEFLFIVPPDWVEIPNVSFGLTRFGLMDVEGYISTKNYEGIEAFLKWIEFPIPEGTKVVGVQMIKLNEPISVYVDDDNIEYPITERMWVKFQ